MTNPRYLVLRMVLLILSIVIAAAGVLMILGGKTLVMWAFMHPPEREVSNLFMMMMKQLGGIFLMLSLMLYFTFRDPVKNIAIFDAFLFGLIILALTPLLAVYTLTLWPPYTVSGLIRAIRWRRSIADDGRRAHRLVSLRVARVAGQSRQRRYPLRVLAHEAEPRRVTA